MEKTIQELEKELTELEREESRRNESVLEALRREELMQRINMIKKRLGK